jgi:hypothetical protein
MSMGGPGEPESLIRADSLAFLSHGSPGGGTLPFIGVSFARFPRRWNPTFHWRFFRTVPPAVEPYLSLAFLSHGSPGGGTLPFIGVSFARFPTSSSSLGRFRFSVFSRLPEESPLAEEGGQGGPGRSGWRRYRPWLRPARQTELLNFMGGGCGLQKDKTGGA